MVLRLFSKSSAADAKAKSGAKAKTGAKAEQAAGARTTASARLAADAGSAEIMQAAQNASNAKERAELIGRLQDVEALKQLASEPNCLALCADRLADIDGTQPALALATDLNARVELAIHAHNSQLRDAQIAAFASEQDLLELERASRSKNKACNRAARGRLDELRQARADATSAAGQAAELADHATRLDDDAHREARFTAIAQKHQSAAEQHTLSSTTLRAFGEAAPALTPMPPAPVTTPAAIEDGPDFRALSGKFKALQQRLIAGTTATALKGAMTDAGKNWREAIATATPDAQAIDDVAKASALFEQVSGCEALLEERAPAITETLARALSEITDVTVEQVAQLPKGSKDQANGLWRQREDVAAQSKLIRELLRGLNYPSAVPAPEIITQLHARQTDLTAFLAACKNRQTQLEDSFKEQVKRLGQALDAGEMKRAEAARGEARILQDALPGGSANSTRKRYGALIANMQNLRDWQHFATDPKREELCEKMTAIADAPKAPDEQADLVKDLRAQWNALGGKGPKEIAERFDSAAARAFEPCREHYAELAESRAKNLATRKGILEQIESFVAQTDWANADLAGARTILNSARTEWRNAFPVERGANRGLEKRFQSATDKLYEHLQEGWSGNLAAKEALVTTAEALLTSEDPLPQRLDKAKRLQQDWKQTGPVPRGPDQKLWKRFRAACDALFNARDEERTQAKAASDAQRQAATALLDRFEQTLAATAAAELERSLLTQLKSDLAEIENLDSSITSRARTLEDRFADKIKEKAAAKKQATLTELMLLDEQAAASELDGQPLPEEVIAGNKVFSQRSSGEPSAHLDLVLEAESQAGIDSPADNAQRRLELQVEWLNAGMNSGARKTASGMDLAQRWCALRANESSGDLRERLFAAAGKLL